MKQASRSQSRPASQKSSGGTLPKPVRVEELGAKVEQGVTHLDADRADAYLGLLTIQSSKDSILDRRARLYATKYGAQDPRIARVKRQREMNVRLQRATEVAAADAAVPVPDVDERSYVLHGFVRNRSREPLPKLTVALYDEKGELVRETGYACTEDNGYFQLRYEGPARNEKPQAAPLAPKQQVREKVTARAPTRAEKSELKTQQQIVEETAARETKPSDGSRSETSHTEASGRRYQIHVYRDEQLLHRDPNPVQPRPKRIDYREIVIDGEGCECSPPPKAAEPQKVSKAAPAPVKSAPAAPSTKKKK